MLLQKATGWYLPTSPAKMTVQSELSSWIWSPFRVQTSPMPQPGTKAPSTESLTLPGPSGKPVILAFLRHCGCPCKFISEASRLHESVSVCNRASQLTRALPVAEKEFRALCSVASQHPEIRCVAVSHSDAEATARWLDAIGGAQQVEVVIDDASRDLYRHWGLGVTGLWHVLSPWSLWSVVRLGRQEDIHVRPTESGSRWQRSGSFGIDRHGVVKWTHAAAAADNLPVLSDAITSIEGG